MLTALPNALSLGCKILLIGYLCLFLVGWLLGSRLVFPMPSSSYKQMEPEWFKIPYGEDGHQVVARILHAPQPQGYILYQHGNYEDLGQITPRLELLRDLGYTVLAWDYPGYGLSSGKSSEKTVSIAARAVAAYAAETLGWPAGKTIIYGRSVGGGPSVLLASETAYRGLILECTFISAFRVVTRKKIVPFDVFDNLSRIGSIKAPVLLLHGTRDEVVPFSHGPQLLAAAPEPKQHLWIKGGMHNNLAEDFRQAYLGAVNSFLSSLPVRETTTDTSSAKDTPRTNDMPHTNDASAAAPH